MNIYIGNLSYSSGDTDIRTIFERFGEVDTVSVITDKFTGKSRGFAFVEMPDSAAAKEAIDGLNGTEFDEREIVVREARPRTERSNDRGGGGGGGRGQRY
jgi:cold-inducible RNA-binding protein